MRRYFGSCKLLPVLLLLGYKAQVLRNKSESFEAHVCVASLPKHIRPAVCAFGGLADGFLPFDVGGGRTEQLHLASIVMKAVQARSPVPS